MKCYYMVGGSVRQEADGLLINGVGYRAQEILRLAAENQALRERAEAAEAERDATRDESLRELATMEVAALAWEAGRDAAAADVAHFGRLFLSNGDNVTVDIRRDLAALTPPADLSAALTARMDAELERAVAALKADAKNGDISEGALQWCLDTIRALRRAAPTEGEA